MNQNDINLLSRKFPLSAATIARNKADGDGNGPRSVIQKRQTAIRDEQKEPRMDEDSDRAFRIHVTLKMCDRRNRDCDGALATLLDCLIAARRQLEDNSGYFSRGGDVSTR